VLNTDFLTNNLLNGNYWKESVSVVAHDGRRLRKEYQTFLLSLKLLANKGKSIYIATQREKIGVKWERGGSSLGCLS
jgi:hypothetical protein